MFVFLFVLIPCLHAAEIFDSSQRKSAISWDQYAKNSITRDLESLNKNNYFTKNIKRTLEKPSEEGKINPQKIKRLEHELVHNNVLKTYIRNLLKSFIKERRRLMQDDEPPQPDIPIELGMNKQQKNKELLKESKEQCKGGLCNEIENEKNLPSDVHAGVYHEEEFSASSDKEMEDNHDVFNGESDDEMFPPKAPEIPIELGSAFQQSDKDETAETECDSNKKPCQQPCTGNSDCPPDEAPPEPDIPIELGSARSVLTEDANNSPYTEDEATFIPQNNLPKNFVVVENNLNLDTMDTFSGSGETGVSGEEEIAQKRSLTTMASGDHNATANDDGNFDGELLTDDPKTHTVENSVDFSQYSSLRSQRKRRNAKQLQSAMTSENNLLPSNGKASKRSDIDEDKELLQTIESIDTEMATKRGLSRNDKPLQGYMQKLAHDVRSVMGEARNVLRNTGRVVHGLKRVINGATVLTSFTNNAVKFAKYFSMEPDNATIDYLEEKAIVAVLEAQKAANEARDAANLAKIASTKARAAERRMEVARKQHKSLENILPYIKTATRQAERAERASLYASKNKQKTETDVMLMDKELKKMGAQLKKQNEQNIESSEPSSDGTNIDKKDPQQSEETSGVQSGFDDDNSNKKGKTKSYDEDYFYKKQKQLEEELKGKTKSPSSIQALQNFAATNKAQINQASIPYGVDSGNKTTYSNTTIGMNSPQMNTVSKVNEGPKLELYFKEGQKNQEAPKLSETQPQDTAELQYIASLNKRIASIKKEEEEAKERLKAAELARNFVASTTSKMVKSQESFSHFPENSNNVARSNPMPIPVLLAKPAQPVLHEEIPKLMKPSFIRNALPEKKSKQVKHIPHTKEKPFSKKFTKPITMETPEYNVPSVVKKEFAITPAKSSIQPDESTGFRKQEILGSKVKTKATKKFRLPIKEITPSSGVQEFEKIENTLNGAENNLVSEKYNPVEKRERVLYESKLLSEKLRKMNSALRGLKFNIPVPKADKESLKRHIKKSEFAQTVNKGPITVTVAVHSNHLSNSTVGDNVDKNVDFIDPFGFKNMEDTNEGLISDRNKIPRPSDYYKVEYQRSFIPRPASLISRKDEKKELVVNEKK